MTTTDVAKSISNDAPVREVENRDVVILIIDNPPVNAISFSVRKGLVDGITRANKNTAMRGVVIIGNGKTFISGSDIREFDAPLQTPTLPDVIQTIEKSRLPVVAAIQRHALGGGFELALACDARVADTTAMVGLPEVSLGMIPGAGGTQRTTFVVGKARAIDIVTSSRHLDAQEAEALGLINRVVETELIEAAIDYVRSLNGSKSLIRNRNLPIDDPETLEKAKNNALLSQKRLPTVQDAIDAIDLAGQISFDEALARERATFNTLRTGPVARALRHLFFAERQCLRSDKEDSLRASLKKIGVVGAGTMGVGITGCLTDAGFDVIVYDKDAAAARSVTQKLSDGYSRDVKKGKLSPNDMKDRIDRVSTTTSIDGFRDVDFLIEAVFEDMSVKTSIMTQLHAVLPQNAILASNTSYLDLNALGQAVDRPDTFVGLHFFSPAQVMRLVEVIDTEITSARTLGMAIQFAKQLGKIPVVSQVSEGFIGNRIYAAYRRQCEYMLEEGASPGEIDNALEDFGFAMGPFAVADLSGLDIAWKMRQRLNAKAHSVRYVSIPDALCEAGRFGRKTKQGYYKYEEGQRRGLDDPEVQKIIENERSKKHIVSRFIAPEEIVERALGAIVSEAANVLQEKVARSANDIDVVMVAGYGFPRFRGGPLFWAREQGKNRIAESIERLKVLSGPDFKGINLRVIFE